MFGWMIALERLTESVIALAMPDLGNRFLKNIAQYTLFAIFTRCTIAKGREAAGEHIAARGNIRQGIGPVAARPGALTEVACDTFKGTCRACCIKANAQLFALLYAL